jgi:histidine triad (HIT) family protein
MDQQCLFCKIIAGKIPAAMIYEDKSVCAFRDINPQGPVHILILPKEHIASLNDLSLAEEPLMGHIMLTAARLARDNHVAETGYRIVFNCGRHGGQSVEHIHGHLLAGRSLHWPPG